jgi:5'-deoxynucleotidase YfbR-like HD superfamily hydrolase
VNHEDLLEFLRNAGDLKMIPRTGWVQAGIKEPESVADHSFRMTLLAMVLSDQMGLDTEKVVRMALIHDLAESRTGDLPQARNPMTTAKTSQTPWRRYSASCHGGSETDTWGSGRSTK